MSKAKVSLTPQQVTDQWAQKMKGSVARIQAGIDSVTENPMEKAAAAADKYQAGIIESVASGRYQAGCRGVNVTDWKNRTKTLVGQRLAGGVDAALPKRQKFDSWLVPTLNSILPSIAGMPDMTFEDSKNRAVAFMDAMHNRQYKTGG